MNRYQLSQSLNHLPDDLLEEAQAVRSRRKRRRPMILAAAAACLLLAAALWALTARSHSPELPLLPMEPSYGGFGDNSLSPEDFESYDGGPWQEGMELTSLPVFRNTTRMDAANRFRTGGGDYVRMRQTLEQLAAAAGADLTQAAARAQVPDAAVRQAMEAAWTDGSWQCTVTFAKQEDGPTELTLEQGDITVTVSESGRISVAIARQDLAEAGPQDAAAWLLERYPAIFGDRTRHYITHPGSQDEFVVWFYQPQEDLTQGIICRSILPAYAQCNGTGCTIWLYQPDLSEDSLMGDYPLITPEEARQRLADGRYLNGSGDPPQLQQIRRVDLQYLARETDACFIPCYVFWLEQTGEQGTRYYPYYVPAVVDAYLSGQSPSPTGAA